MADWGRKPGCTCGECQKCKHRLYMRTWYQRKSPEERRAWRERRDVDRVREVDRARHHRNKQDPDYIFKREARAELNAAIRAGRLERGNCEVCGAIAQAHHEDYSKPFDVRWLCSVHHAAEHAPEASWKEAA